MAVPIAIGIALLRYRLYDIDLIINRTLVYAVLTPRSRRVPTSVVLLLRVLLSPVTGGSDLAVAASTLAVAALFRPVRARIQAVVDRRFYRRRYDAARTVSAFAGRLRPGGGPRRGRHRPAARGPRHGAAGARLPVAAGRAVRRPGVAWSVAGPVVSAPGHRS